MVQALRPGVIKRFRGRVVCAETLKRPYPFQGSSMHQDPLNRSHSTGQEPRDV